MTNDLYFYGDAQSFGAGEQINVFVSDGALVLCETNGHCLPSGCYTAPEAVCAPFSALIASWNSDTPAGTAVEVQVRVRAQGKWSTWLSYGKWSPFLASRGSVPYEAHHEYVRLDTDTVTITGMGADAFQLRAFLYADADGNGPALRLLAASVRTARYAPQRGEPLQRCVPVPAYSQAIRDPQLVRGLANPTALAMLMNRFGEDVLPEEVALRCYDSTADSFDNHSFSTALAGCYGYECYPRFGDVAMLKQEIKHGFGCGVRVTATNTAAAVETGLPLAQGSAGEAKDHVLVVRGFEMDESGAEFVLVNDSLASCNAAAQRRYPLAEFEAAWNGVAYILHAKHHCHTLCPPYRIAACLPPAELPGEYALTVCGERRSLPVHFTQQSGVCTGSVCYALHEAHAYATTAHKCFFYGGVSENGNVLLDASVSAGAGLRFTVFVIGNAGVTYAAELIL